ncbi:MAG: hypothetical protein ABII96_02975 [Candidatus Zixiibacteriota bacterium]
MKRYFLILLMILLTAALTESVWAQADSSSIGMIPQGKSGKLIVYYGGEESGSEIYSVTKQEGNVVLFDTSQFQVSGISILIKLQLVMDTTLSAINLNINGSAPGGPYQIKTEFTNGKAVNHISGGLDTTYEVPVHKDALILPNGIFYPYTFLVQRYDLDKGGTQQFYAYTSPMEIDLKVEDKGKEKVDFDTSSVELRQFFVNVAGMVGVYVWANDDGEIYKISIPMQGIEVYKEGYEPGKTKSESDTIR